MRKAKSTAEPIKRKYRPARKPKRALEKHIQRDILRWLATTTLFFWRQNAGFVQTASGGRIQLGRSGLPDIFVVLPIDGRLLGLEVKRPGQDLRESQIACQHQLLASGARYEVVHSVKEAIGAVHKHHWIKDFP